LAPMEQARMLRNLGTAEDSSDIAHMVFSIGRILSWRLCNFTTSEVRPFFQSSYLSLSF